MGPAWLRGANFVRQFVSTLTRMLANHRVEKIGRGLMRVDVYRARMPVSDFSRSLDRAAGFEGSNRLLGERYAPFMRGFSPSRGDRRADKH
jgi:hypothetical protein